MSRTGAIAGVLAAVWLIGCGGAPSAVDVCKRSCEKTVTCTGGTTSEIAQCQAGCTESAASAQYQGCTNGDDIRSCVNGCLGVADCNDSAKCVSGCPKCVTNGTGGTSGGGGGSDGSTSGNSMSLDAVALCKQTCQKLAMCAGGSVDPTQCDSNCANATIPASCTNASAVYSCTQACNAGDCQSYSTCVQACPKCS